MLDVYTIRLQRADTAASNTFLDPSRLIFRVELRSPRMRNARCTTTSAPSTNLATSPRFVTSPWTNSVRIQPCSLGTNGRRAIAVIEPTPGVFSKSRTNGRPISPVAPVTATFNPAPVPSVVLTFPLLLEVKSPKDARGHGKSADQRGAAPSARASPFRCRDCGRTAGAPRMRSARVHDGPPRNGALSAKARHRCDQRHPLPTMV